MPRVTRYEQLLLAFVQAGHAGLTWREVERHGGSEWRKHLKQLRDNGAVITTTRGRYPTRAGFFRATMVAEPVPPRLEVPEPADETPCLFATTAAAALAIDDDYTSRRAS